MHILVIRHGQPHDESKSGGDGDPPLSELGISQAQSIGDYLSGETDRPCRREPHASGPPNRAASLQATRNRT